MNATPDALLDLVSAGVDVVDLGRPLFRGMPQSANHPPYWHTLPRRHGDMVRADGSSAANDQIVMGTHVGTHIDALAHVSHEGRLHGGVPVEEAMEAGGFPRHGVHTIDPMIRRAVLLDVPRALGVDACEGGYEITVDDLELAEKQSGTEVGPGDVVLVRSGWGARFDDGPAAYAGADTGVPGVSAAGASWLNGRRVHAAGADTIAFERLAAREGHAALPAHRILLVEAGIYLVEALDLEALGDRLDGGGAFTLVLVPMRLTGATGSPVRPLAVFAR
ncbi:MAG: cyclase family protein [Propionibacteriales bacterium]|nr:cyclase family protein [Propionibacteriales bacterium]